MRRGLGRGKFKKINSTITKMTDCIKNNYLTTPNLPKISGVKKVITNLFKSK